MAREHGGDLYDFANLSDAEIREIVVQHLRETPGLDHEWMDVDVNDGFVRLSGRVGTDGEVEVAETVVHDVLGIERYVNELVVDELHRGDRPMAADLAAAEEREIDDPLGGTGEQHSDTAQHLVEDVEQETFGTHDPGRAVEQGETYIPPDGPAPGGYGSREDH
jgi:hypothetical protein